MDPITVPFVPNLDGYIYAYMAWAKDLIGHNLVFFGGLAFVTKWVVNKTSWSWDNKLLEVGRGLVNQVLTKKGAK